MFRRAVSTTTPEDAILSILEWARQGGDSARQLRDAASVLTDNPGVDRAYIERWARKRNLIESWKEISRFAGPHR
jgi:hypothetical protein